MKQLILIIAVCLNIYKVWAQSDFQDPATGMVFPAEMGKLKTLSATNFEEKSAGLGVGLNYQNPEDPRILISVYVYNLKMKNISDGADSEPVKYSFKEAESQIFAAQKNGIYKKVKKISPKKEDFANGNLLDNAIFGQYSFKVKNIAMVSSLWVTGYRENVVKIRFTYPQDNEKIGKETLIFFIENIKKLMGN
jgi:hypothetical protein